MARLPTPGGDEGNWSDILNDYLGVAHASDGTIKNTGIVATKANDSDVVHNTSNETVAGNKTFSNPPTIPAPTSGTDATNKTYVDTAVAAGTPDATTTSKGKIQLAGDLGGTAAAPTIAAGAIDNSKISASAAIAESKLALASDARPARLHGVLLAMAPTKPPKGARQIHD